MIQFKIDNTSLSNFTNELNNKFFGIQELTKPRTLEAIAKASFTITGKRFVTAMDRKAQTNPKKYHHIYEWGQIGSPSARLFVVRRMKIQGGHLTLSLNFKRSKRPVPIPKELQVPGKTGKRVSTKHIFFNKAQVMEDGQPVHIHAARVLAFLGNNGVQFVPAGTVINILNPGGKMVKNSFKQFSLEWYRKNYAPVMDSSGIFNQIEREVALVLNKNNNGAPQARQTIINITNRYAEGLEAI
jgi:hypothetical protein